MGPELPKIFIPCPFFISVRLFWLEMQNVILLWVNINGDYLQENSILN